MMGGDWSADTKLSLDCAERVATEGVVSGSGELALLDPELEDVLASIGRRGMAKSGLFGADVELAPVLCRSTVGILNLSSVFCS